MFWIVEEQRSTDAILTHRWCQVVIFSTFHGKHVVGKVYWRWFVLMTHLVHWIYNFRMIGEKECVWIRRATGFTNYSLIFRLCQSAKKWSKKPATWARTLIGSPLNQIGNLNPILTHRWCQVAILSTFHLHGWDILRYIPLKKLQFLRQIYSLH